MQDINNINNITIDTPSLILEYLKSLQQPRISEKNKNGEVLTPPHMIDDSLDQLDAHYKKCNDSKGIFSIPSLRWFEPSVGIGNFMIVIFQRLMDGLVYYFPDKENRKRHILEKMLFMSELNVNNVETCKGIFKADVYNLNIFAGDTLSLDIGREWNVDKFDVIIGNPPYNSNGIKHIGNKNIYVGFVNKALSILKPSGYLCYLHPPTYRIPYHKIQHTGVDLNAIYTNLQIIYIRMFPITSILKMMSVMMNIDCIIIKNERNNNANDNNANDNNANNTLIIDTKNIQHVVKIRPHDFIPNYGINIMNKIKNKYISNIGNVQLHLDSQMHAQCIKKNNQTDANAREQPIKNVHGITAKGIKILLSYGEKQHKYYTRSKIIINGIGSHNYVLYDKNGIYGITQSPLYILTPDNNTIQMVMSRLFHYISNATKIIGNNYAKETEQFLPMIPSEISIASEKDLYDYFEFSADEINEINVSTIPLYANVEIIT